MDEQRRGRRNLAQNLLITLLTLTAAALFTQTQLYSMGVDRGASALGGAAQTAGAAEPGELAAPVRVAVLRRPLVRRGITRSVRKRNFSRLWKRLRFTMIFCLPFRCRYCPC